MNCPGRSCSNGRAIRIERSRRDHYPVRGERVPGTRRRARLRQRRRRARPARRRSRPTPSRPAPACASRSPGSPCATSSADRDVDLRRRRAHPRRRAVVDDPDDRRRRRGDRRHRAGPRADPRPRSRRGKPVVTANKELLANVGAELFAAADDAGRRPAVRGGGRRRHPAHPPAARVAASASRSAACMGIVNGTTNYILTQMTEDGRRLRRRAGRGAGARATPSATPPPTSRASTPGPRRRSSPSIAFGAAGRGRRRLPRGHQRHHRRRHRLRRAASATSSSCWPSPSSDRPTRRGRACGCTRRWCPSHHPLASVREQLQRRVRRGRRPSAS